MAYDKIKQQYVRVYGEDGQHRIVEVLSTPDVRTIMSKVLHKFGIENEDVGKYSIFVGSSDTGAGKLRFNDSLNWASICSFLLYGIEWGNACYV